MNIRPTERVAYLIPLAGPALEHFELAPGRSPLTLGRHESCQLPIPPGEERVSRVHASFELRDGTWFITDRRSTWGTYLNGYRLPPSKPFELSQGDIIRITPWTFSFRFTLASDTSIRPRNDLEQAITVVRRAQRERMPADPLALLIEAAAAIHKITDEQTLAEVVVDFARRGTGHQNAAYLRPSGAEGQIEILAGTGSDQGYSRSLLMAASQGELAMLDTRAQQVSHSIVAMGIRSAMCAPLMLGSAVAAYLYLDLREGDHPHGPRNAHDQDYCLALSRVASLALANIKRVEIERRQAMLDSQLAQAAAIQQYILPPPRQQVGQLLITGRSRPGQFLGGDFFDVIPLSQERVLLTLGDVSGKGVAASVLMTTIHGYLHAQLSSGVAPHEAVRQLNAFLQHRKPEERFATLFVALIDTQAGQLTYVDAAHGYGMTWDGQRLIALQDAGGPPVGAFPDLAYDAVTIPFRRGDALLVVSDGIVEQPAGDSVERRQFDIGGIEQAMKQAASTGYDELDTLFAAVETFAGTTSLADDATALLAKWV